MTARPPERSGGCAGARARERGGERGAERGAERGGERGGERAHEEVSAGGIVFRLAPGEDGRPRPVFLLIRDSYRNWGFPKGHVEPGEEPAGAAAREVAEETGLDGLAVRGALETIDWYFRFRGRLIHKVCHFYLVETAAARTCPQRAEGITACRWATYEEAMTLVAYANARDVLRLAQAAVARRLAEGPAGATTPADPPTAG